MPHIKQEIDAIPEGQNPLDLAIWSEKTSQGLRTDLHALKHEDSTFSGAMEIDGSTDISTALYVDGSQDVLNTLACSSDFAVAGDVSVDGTAVFGDASFDGTVDFGDGAAFAAEVSIDGVVKVDSSAEFSDVYVSGDLTVLGRLAADNSADFSDVFAAGDISIAGTLKVATDFTLTGDMAVDGTSNFYGEVDFSAVNISGIVGALGDWSARAVDTTYTATTDGWFTAYINKAATVMPLRAQTPAGTDRQIDTAASGYTSCVACLVRKGDTWAASADNTTHTSSACYWLPIGAN